MSAYYRAEPARIGTILPALSVATLAGAAPARPFGCAGALRIVANADRMALKAAVRPLFAEAVPDRALAALIKRLRRGE